MQQRRQPANGNGRGGGTTAAVRTEEQQQQQQQPLSQDAGAKEAGSTPGKATGRGCYFSLAFSIGSMGLACGSLWQIPNSSDRISLQRGLVLTSLGFIYFVSLTDFCNKYLLETTHGQRFRRKYRLMMSDVLEITNK